MREKEKKIVFKVRGGEGSRMLIDIILSRIFIYPVETLKKMLCVCMCVCQAGDSR